MQKEERGQWSSKIGFIMAAAGAAIGLGNIWRFPYLTGENGGGAFVLLYLFFVLLFGIPSIIAELALGRYTRRNPVGAFKAINKSPIWVLTGFLAVITCLGILSFYSVIAGWTFGYIFRMLSDNVLGFAEFVANPYYQIPLFGLFLVMTALIVVGGIEKGIEKWSKILMPLLFVIMIGLIIYANTLEGSFEGIKFYLQPDFSKITFKTVLAAIGQAFFSLSIGMGMMVTYGSYLSKDDSLVVSGISVGLLDTAIALMAGFVIFPSLFSMGESPAAGPTLVFQILPRLFHEMPGGLYIGAFFFILLSIAAITSTISMLEVPVAYFIDEKKISRKKIVWIATGFTFLLGLPSALSYGASDFFTNFALLPESIVGKDFLSHISFIFGDFALVIGSLMIAIFVGWIWGTDKASAEINSGSKAFRYMQPVWAFLIKYFIPVIIIVVLIKLFGII